MIDIAWCTPRAPRFGNGCSIPGHHRRCRFEQPHGLIQPVDAGSNKRRQLDRIEEPAGRLVVHATRLYDGLGGAYQADVDIIIDGGRITALEPHRDRTDAIVIDMGDLTVIPGYIDTLAELKPGYDKFGDNVGPLLLLSGVTTLVADHAEEQTAEPALVWQRRRQAHGCSARRTGRYRASPAWPMQRHRA